MFTLSNNVCEQLNLIPERDVFIPFDIWYQHYKNDIFNIFAFFKERLHDVQPFSDNLKNLDSEKTLKKFATFLYHLSSKVLK